MPSCSGEFHISDYLTVLMNRFKFHLTGGCERSAEVRPNTFLDINTLEYLISNTHIRGSNTWAKLRAKRQSPRVTVPASLRAA